MAWEAFRKTPTMIPVAGYGIGALVAIVALLPLPPATAAVAFIVWVYLVTGINHIDGVVDLGDALVVHGTPADRRAVMKDTTVGVGGALAVAVVVLGLATTGFALASLPTRTVGLVVAAEVGAKLGMTVLVCLGESSHEGLGSALTSAAGPRSLIPAVALAVPAVAATSPRFVPSIAALAAALLATGAVFAWARRNLGGVSGDVFGATNEIARIAALHAGVIAWTHW